MGTRAVNKGPGAERVASNVRTLREERGMSLRRLSERLGKVGRPMLASGLSKIEQGDRRADADDLVALAIALDVTPNRLLLPADAGDDVFALTGEVDATGAMAWRWAAGDEPLPGTAKPYDAGRAARFHEVNRPHEADDMPAEDVEERYRDVLGPLWQAVADARERGLPLGTILSYVRISETARRVLAWRQALDQEED